MTTPDAARRHATAVAVLIAITAAAPTSAFALSGDRIVPSVGLGYTFTDNVFFLDRSNTSLRALLLENNQMSDMFLSGRAGLRVNYPVSRQIIKLRANVSRNDYQTYNRLDHTAYDFGADLDWDLGSKWDGVVGYDERLALGSFADQRLGLGNERNLRTLRNAYGGANYAITPDMKFRTNVNLFRLENSVPSFSAGNREDLVYAVGLRRYSKGKDDFLGVNLAYTDGKFPDREEFTPGTFIDNSYKQYRLSGDVDYTYSGLTRFEADWGYTSRQHDVLPQRNFDGLTGRLTVRYGLTRRTSFNAAVFREIGAFDDVTTTFIVTQGYSVGARHQLTGRVALSANYIFRNRRFTGDPGFIVAQIPARDEDIQLASVSATWEVRRNVSANASLAYTTREANRPFGAFNVTTLSVGGTLLF